MNYLKADRAAADYADWTKRLMAVNRARRQNGARGCSFCADDGTFENRNRAACLGRVQDDRRRGTREPTLVIAGKRRDPLDTRYFEITADVRRQRDDAVGCVRKTQEARMRE